MPRGEVNLSREVDLNVILVPFSLLVVCCDSCIIQTDNHSVMSSQCLRKLNAVYVVNGCEGARESPENLRASLCGDRKAPTQLQKGRKGDEIKL